LSFVELIGISQVTGGDRMRDMDHCYRMIGGLCFNLVARVDLGVLIGIQRVPDALEGLAPSMVLLHFEAQLTKWKH